MTLGTAVFRRIVEEAKASGADSVRGPAVRAIADTMEETVRFGCFRKEYIEDRAAARLEAALRGEKF